MVSVTRVASELQAVTAWAAPPATASETVAVVAVEVVVAVVANDEQAYKHRDSEP